MEFLQLKYFQTVAKHQHMTRAAQELSIVQPALSQTIARLEKNLGVPLFEREGRQIRLNQFGRTFLKYVDKAFYELDAGQREINELVGLQQRTISMALMTTTLIPSLLNTFRSINPSVKFIVQQPSREMMLHQLEKGEFDLCISSGPIEQTGINWVQLITEEIFLIIPDTHPLAERTSIHLNEITLEPFIHMKVGSSFRDITDNFCRLSGFIPNIAFEIDERSAIRDLVRAGLGISFVPSLSLKFWDNEPGIKFLHIEDLDFHVKIGLSWKEDRYHSLAALEFRKFIIEYFEQLNKTNSPPQERNHFTI
jgi:DNA-binding transcriptional LysR family regulator